MVKRDLTPDETGELQEIIRLANGRRFEANLVKGNTALIPDGQAVADQLDAIARVVENAKNQHVAAKLTECGYPQGTRCNINLTTGEITPSDEPGDTQNPA